MFSSRILRIAQRTLTSYQRATIPPPATPKWYTGALVAAGVSFCSFNLFSQSDTKELVACKEEELIEGYMKKVQVGDNPNNFIVVAKVEGTVYAVSGKCPHYGAPMNGGFLDGYTMVCPWHAATFDIRTGEMTAAPSVKDLMTFKAEVRDGDVIVHIPEADWNQVTKSIDSKKMVKPLESDKRKFVIVGGGAAGHMCAEELRKEGYTGRIIILTREEYFPYDRVMINKNLKVDSSKFALRSEEFYRDYGIEVRLGNDVDRIDESKKVVHLTNGRELDYDKLLLATGCSPRVPGPFKSDFENLDNVVAIRSAKDHDNFIETINEAKNIVIVGGSFIGLEVATSMTRNFPDKKVTVVELEDIPMQRAFGPDIAQQLVNIHRASGVDFMTSTTTKSINSEGKQAKSITVSYTDSLGRTQEKTIDCDLVLLATGAQMETAYIPPKLLNEDGSVRVDPNLRTSNSNIYAAGDIASMHSMLTESNERIEHWVWAQEQGRHSAMNMLDKGVPFTQAPYFWTGQFKKAESTGFTSGYDWYHTDVRPGEDELTTGRITYFYKNSRCIGVSAINVPGAIIRLKIALERGLMPSKEELAKGEVKYEDIVMKIKESAPTGQKKPCCQDKAK